MKVGVPTEIKTDEYRVALTPAGVRELVEHGHEVLIQAGAGDGSAISDAEYTSQGAAILPDAAAVFAESDMIVKVKEPQAVEVAMLEPRHTLFTYLHLAPDPELTRGLMESGATCVAYETVEDARGRLPLLAPMSEVAGKIATQAGAFMLEKPLGGRGILLGGVPGVAAAKVMIIGGGVVGMNAAFIALGMEATVYVYDRNIDRLRELDIAFGGRADTCYASTLDIEQRLPEVDLVIGAVLVHGAKAPYVIRREQLSLMKRQAVLVDVSIDQGGCFETSRPTTHSDPVYEVDGVLHYCVANMPGAVPVTSTRALTNATLPYVLHVADKGVLGAVAGEPRAGQGRQRRRRQGHLPAGGGGDRPAVRRTVRDARWSRRSLYDAVVIGGGHNGLVAAAYLARAGQTVLVLERADHVGGAAVSERPWEGVDARLSRYSYLVSLLPRAVREELGLTIELRRRSVSSYSPRLDGSGLLVRTGEPPHANWAEFEAMTARVAEAVFPTLTQPLRLARGAAGAGRRRRRLGGAGRAAAGGGARALLRGRLRARDHRHRRADRHLRGPRRRVAAPEPLLPLPRDRQRHGRLGRAGGRHGRADRVAGRDRVRRGRRAAARLRGDLDRDRRRRRRGALRGRLGERAPRARQRRAGRARAAAGRARARSAARGRPAQAQPAAQAAAAAARSVGRPVRGVRGDLPRQRVRDPARGRLRAGPPRASCRSWRRARSTATRSPIPRSSGRSCARRGRRR